MIKYPIKTILFYMIQMVVLALVMGYVIYSCAFRILIDNLEESLTEVAKQGAIAVEVYIDKHIKELQAISLNHIISDSSLTYEERMTELARQLELDSFKRLSIADREGHARTTDGIELEIGDREYFQKAISGIANVSDPVRSRADNTMVIAFAVPIYEKKQIIGVLYGTHDAAMLSKITDKIRLGAQGNSFIINEYGDTLAHDNRQLVYDRDNDFTNYQRDPSLKRLANLERKMIAGETGAGDYIYQGIEKYMGYSPIGNTQWSIAVTAPKSQVLAKINQVLGLIISSVILISFIITIINIYSGSLKRRLFQEKVIANRIIDIANIIIMSIDKTGKIISCNKYGKELLHRFSKSPEDKVKNIFKLLPGEEGIQLKDVINQGTLNTNFELTLAGEEKEPMYLLCTMNKAIRELNDDEYFDVIGVDITERVESHKKLQESYQEIAAANEEITAANEEITAANEEIIATNEALSASEEELRQHFNELIHTQEKLMESDQRYHLAVEGSNDAIWDWSFNGNQVYYSGKFYEIIGLTKDEAGHDIAHLYHPEDLVKLREAIRAHIRGESSFVRYEVRIKTKSEGYKWLLVRGKGIINEKGRATRIAGSITDITEIKTHENRIHQLAYFDVLTGLPNRVLLYEEIGKSVQDSLDNHLKGALVFIDLDNFKFINDSCGHSVGDILLIEVAKRLVEIQKDAGFVSRLGGDEFIILIKDLKKKSQLEECLRKIMDAFHSPFCVAENNFYISISCGITLFPDDGIHVDHLLRNADMAMYHAKKNGKHKYAMFDKDMDEQLVKKINMETGLRRALENGEFILQYQPQFDLMTGKIYGFEALIRWASPLYGYLMPLKFIHIAEESGLIIPIGKWVLKKACGYVKDLHNQGYDHLKVAVNISVIQLMQTDFIETIADILDEVGLAPSCLELELTESILMETIGSNINKLERLQELGIQVLIDDFGKGYSSLSYLKELPVNKLKIDKSFVAEIGHPNDFTEAIIQIGHKMGLGIVAEGVETQTQLDFLLKTKCNFAQGYLLSIPVLPEEVPDLLRDH